jgi:hypothetical protein
MDHSKSRPSLPGSTPAPPPQGRTSAYSSSTPAVLSKALIPSEENALESKAKDKDLSYVGKQLLQQEKAIIKMVSRLPFELRESVNSVVTMAIRTAENIQKDLEVSRQEAVSLKNEIIRKNHELHTMGKFCDTYQQKIKSLEGNVDNLQDNVQTSQTFNSKNRSAINKLAFTNRMLISALEALKTTDEHMKGTGALMDDLPPRAGLLEPINKRTDAKPGIVFDDINPGDGQIPLFQKDQLRESLLRVSREHYKSLKNAEALESKVTELRATLKATENMNRKLKSDIEDMRLHSSDRAIEERAPSFDNSSGQFKNKNFGQIDERFKVHILSKRITFVKFSDSLVVLLVLVVGTIGKKYDGSHGWCTSTTSNYVTHG